MTKHIPKAYPKGVSKSDFLPSHKLVDLEKLGDGKVVFTFTYLDTDHEAFNCGGNDPGWFLHLFDNLKEICRLSRNEFIVQQRNHYDVHSHDWEKAEFKYELPGDLLEQLEEDKCIQFRLSSSGGRVHGFMLHNTFYVVWFDPHHNLYPDQRFGGMKFYDKPLSPYDHLLIERNELQQEVGKLNSWIDAYTGP